MNPVMVGVYGVPKELEMATLAMPGGSSPTTVASAGVF
jgi:hypothetical protein